MKTWTDTHDAAVSLAESIHGGQKYNIKYAAWPEGNDVIVRLSTGQAFIFTGKEIETE